MTLSKTFPVKFTAVASGDGYWGMREGTGVTFDKIVLHVRVYDGDMSAELCAYHNKDAHKYGLCYTDSGVENAVKAFVDAHPELSTLVVSDSVGGSEQGMQDACMLSCDADMHDSVTPKMLIDLGFE
jgi:hypothetical protein